LAKKSYRLFLTLVTITVLRVLAFSPLVLEVLLQMVPVPRKQEEVMERVLLAVAPVNLKRFVECGVSVCVRALGKF
jgi:hypothetical protein